MPVVCIEYNMTLHYVGYPTGTVLVSFISHGMQHVSRGLRDRESAAALSGLLHQRHMAFLVLASEFEYSLHDIRVRLASSVYNHTSW